ncbi:hypothetical protein HHI36_009388 [Cryptolaemus montrouzieri]|uniref:Uncharacterized protein n=1 Tax=Cryptolaemus montrouzieri TaxID=559131 RepID=A0ABD2MVL5_9CUCU
MREETNTIRKNHRSHSIDQIPTRDVTSEHKDIKRSERTRSVEKRVDSQTKNGYSKYFSPIYTDTMYAMNEENLRAMQNLQKKHRGHSKRKRKYSVENHASEFVSLDQIKEQTMNLQDLNIEHHEQRKWPKYHNLKGNKYEPQRPEKDMYKVVQPFGQTLKDEEEIHKNKKKEKRKHKQAMWREDFGKDYNELKKYVKKIGNEYQGNDIEMFNFLQADSRPIRNKKHNEHDNQQNYKQDPKELETNNHKSKNKSKQHRKDLVPLDLELKEQEIPPIYHRKHEHNKRKNKKDTTKNDLTQKMRYLSLSVDRTTKERNPVSPHLLKKDIFGMKDNIETGLKLKYRSESTLDFIPKSNKDLVCLYQNKDPLDQSVKCGSVELSKKKGDEYILSEKCRKDELVDNKKVYNGSSSRENQAQNKKRNIVDILNMQQRAELFEKAMRKDFPTRPRPRLSRSRQRSSRLLTKLDDRKVEGIQIKKDTTEVHCYDVGTSTILDNNFGEIFELLKNESIVKPLSDKRRSIFHVKKKVSREELIEAGNKVGKNEDTLGIIVKGIEPRKKLDTSKVKSRFKLTPEKIKLNRLECKILSVVAINPDQIDNHIGELEQHPMETMSTPQLEYRDAITDMKNPADRRLERLLKYYRVEPQTKFGEGSSCNSLNINRFMKNTHLSFKELITSKLADYLKKIQEDSVGETLEIQTDDPTDPTIVKLVLPINCIAPECLSEISNNTEKNLSRIPKESFSDLNINYADTNEEDEKFCFHQEVPKESSSLDISSQGKDRKIVDTKYLIPRNTFLTKSNHFDENYTAFAQMEITSPTLRIAQKCERAIAVEEPLENFSCSEKNNTFSPERCSCRCSHFLNNTLGLLTNSINSEGVTLNQRNCHHCEQSNYSEYSENTCKNVIKSELDVTEERYRSSKEENKTGSSYIGCNSFEHKPKFQIVEKCDRIKDIQTEQTLSLNDDSFTCNKQNSYAERRESTKIADKKNLTCIKTEQTLTINDNSFTYKQNSYAERGESPKIADEKNLRCIQELPLNKKHDKGYEYFEIPPPKHKSRKKMQPEEYRENAEVSSKRQSEIKSKIFNKNSSIPRRLPNTVKFDRPHNTDIESSNSYQNNEDKKQYHEKTSINNLRRQDIRKHEEKPKNLKEKQDFFLNNIDTDEINSSLQKCLNWNNKVSDTVVMSEFEETAKTSVTEKSTIITSGIPKKSNIPVVRKDRPKSPSVQGKSSSVGDNNTTMFLTKSYKLPPGQSAYERRKRYDTRIRKNIKKRSLSESNEPNKNLPLIYEVRYFNVYNNTVPDLGSKTFPYMVKSDSNLSKYSRNHELNNWSAMSLSSSPSCFLKESKYGFTEENLRNDRYSDTISKNNSQSELSPKINTNISIAGYSGSSEVYTFKNKLKPKKLKRKNEKVHYNLENLGIKIEKPNENKPKSRITVKCSRKFSKNNGRKMSFIAKVSNKQTVEKRHANDHDDSESCQNMTQLIINKAVDNEICVVFENQKLSSVESECANNFDEKSVAIIHSCSGLDSIDNNSLSSKSTVINCPTYSSSTSESKDTVKEFEKKIVFEHQSTVDSGYLTKGAEVNCSETTLESSNQGVAACCSNIFKGISTKLSRKKSNIPRFKFTKSEFEHKKYKENALVRLKNQLLFPDVYDDFELYEASKNTELIKYYVESVNLKLKQAIDSISQKGDMKFKSRSVISLPSVRMIPEESSDISSNYSYRKPGGFYNYQKFIAQNNEKYSTEILSKINLAACGDGIECPTPGNYADETESVKSSSSISTKKSFIEIFKLRPSSARESSSCLISTQDVVEADKFEKKNTNISDEEFFNNFHNIMALECQRFAKKNKDSKLEDSIDCLDSEFQLACEDVNNNNKSLTPRIGNEKNSSESFKSVTCVQDNSHVEKKESLTKRWHKILKKSSNSNSKFNLDFYSQEKISIASMINNVDLSSMSADSLNTSPRISDIIPSGDLTKQSEKQFFDNLLAFYDKESEFVKKLLRDDEFFTSLTEDIRSSSNHSTDIIFHKDLQKKSKR